jgi:CHASE3 domain sensor protein
MYLSADVTTSWPWSQVILILGLGFLGFALFVAVVASLLDLRKTKLVAKQEGDLRQLVNRYEQLAENTLDAQQRVAADVSELRSRATSIEHILRTVE